MNREINILYIKNFDLQEVDDSTLDKIGDLLANSKSAYSEGYTNSQRMESKCCNSGLSFMSEEEIKCLKCNKTCEVIKEVKE